MRNNSFPGLVVLLLSTSLLRGGSSGQVDPSFVPEMPGQPDGPILSALDAGSGSILVVGDFSHAGTVSIGGVARLKANGSLDGSFNPGTGADNTVNCAAIQADGKILVGGLFQRFNDVPSPKIARLNPDGSLDRNFVSKFDGGGNVNTIAVLTNGLILAGGLFTAHGCTNLMWLDSNGMTNPASVSPLAANGVVNSILIQPDQRILVAGAFTSVNSVSKHGICRLNADGTLDPTFDAGPGPDGPVYTLCLATNGTIILGGRFGTLGGTPVNYLGALSPNGALAPDFAPGTGPNDAVYGVVPDGDAFLVGGRFTQFDGQARGRIARMSLGGKLDSSFAATPGLGDSVFTVVRADSSNIVVGGSFTNLASASIEYVAKISNDAVLNPSFNALRGVAGDVYAIMPSSSGQIIIAGGFLNIDGAGQSGLARLQPDGSFDAAFRPPLTNSFVRTATAQQTGKIVVGGVIYAAGATNFVRLARLDPDGSLDTTFNRPALDDRVQSVVAQADDKILVIGPFQHCNGASERGILRLNPDGTLDSSFSSGAGPDNNINSVAVQTDGRILIAGDFTKYNNLAKNRLARLNPNGSTDPTFSPAASANLSIAALAIMPDGRIVIGGDFESVNGVARNRVARLWPDGSLDGSFDPGEGPNLHVGVILPQVDGKIVLGGFFSSVDSQPRSYFARLNSDGSLDTAFQVGAGANFPVYALTLQSDNRLLVGGSFGYIDNQLRSHIVRLLNQVDNPQIGASLAANEQGITLTIRANGNASIQLQSSSDLVWWANEGPVPIAPGTSTNLTITNISGAPKFFRTVYR